jgi:hypothetical protein
MKIANFYNDLNQQTNGKLYDLVLAVVPALPANYEIFKLPQRQRIGSGVISEQFNWAQVKSARSVKEGSPLGANIMEYLQKVEAATSSEQASTVAHAIIDRLGQIVTKSMLQKEQTAIQAKQAAGLATLNKPTEPTTSTQIQIA